MSGKVLWAHQLLKHMEQPMNLIKVHESLLQTAHGRAVVKKYNKMALVLTEYEIVGYNNWVQVVESTCSNLQVCRPLLQSLISALLVATFTGSSAAAKRGQIPPQPPSFHHYHVGRSQMDETP